MSPLRRLIKLYDTEITKLDVRIAGTFKGDVGFETIQHVSRVLPGSLLCSPRMIDKILGP